MELTKDDILDAFFVLKARLKHQKPDARNNMDIDKMELKIIIKFINRIFNKHAKEKVTHHNKEDYIFKCLEKIRLKDKEIDIEEVGPQELYESVGEKLIFEYDNGGNGYEVEYIMYIGYVGYYKGYYVFKYGYATDLDIRINGHINDYGRFTLLYSEYFYPKIIANKINDNKYLKLHREEIENRMKTKLIELGITRIPFMNGARRKEIFGLKDLLKFENVRNNFKNIIGECEHFKIKELKKKANLVPKLKKDLKIAKKLINEYTKTIKKQDKTIKILTSDDELLELIDNNVDNELEKEDFKTKYETLLKTHNQIVEKNADLILDNIKIKDKCNKLEEKNKKSEDKIKKKDNEIARLKRAVKKHNNDSESSNTCARKRYTRRKYTSDDEYSVD